MSYALNTTKRKFHRILDSISNTSSISLPGKDKHARASTINLPSTADTPLKRPRLERPKSSYVSSSSQDLSQRPFSSIAATIASKSEPKVEERKKPAFVPWDREEFLERLKTFRHVDKWLSKPERINEVEWAKRGWRCVGKERVGCVSCAMELVIKLEEDEQGRDHGTDEEIDEEDWRAAAQEDLVKKYADMVITAHDEGCFWRIRGCDATIYRLPLTHPPTSLDGLLHRYQSLVTMASELPPAVLSADQTDIPVLSKTFAAILSSKAVGAETEGVSQQQFSMDVNEQAFILALFGWQAEEEHIAGLVTCNACFRRLGLWLYKARPSLKEGEDDEAAIMSSLDAVNEHREYCPWINSTSQSGGRAIKDTDTVEFTRFAGWETLVQVLKNSAAARKEVMPLSPIENSQQRDDVASVAETASSAEPEDRATRDAKDKERWARLKKLKQVFHVKPRKKVQKENLAVPK
ncbi:MAG: hypothetical protein MMC33_004179 [Icmadophila ericetorum]|nr:hypothetical protein [Icmadophila ericetorum]